MITLVTGPPGAGKTYYAVRKVVEALEANKVVVTNVPMVADWPQRVANRHLLRWLIPGRRRELAERWARSIHYVETPNDLWQVRVRGTREGRAVAVLDEAHVWMNARAWQAEDREAQVGWFTHHRKLGFDCYLITQDEQNIDRQVRGNYEYHCRLKNLRRMKVAGIPLSPVNLFLAITTWHDNAKSVVRRELYRLTWVADLYDTMGTHSPAVAAPPDALWLPREPGDAPASASTGGAGAAPRRDSAVTQELEPVRPARAGG